jgi:type I restriction enzyme R subunit
MAEFKQIVGRGTRLFPEVDKLTFDIIDFVDATRFFNDPRFGGGQELREALDRLGELLYDVG